MKKEVKKSKKVTLEKKVDKLVGTVQVLSKNLNTLTNTVDNLAISVANGFEGIESRMATKEEMNTRFNTVDERLDKIESRLDNIETNHVNRLDKVEDKVQIIYTAFEKQL